MINPEIVNTLQTQLITHLRESIGVVAQYALHLVYYLTAIEFALFGVMWAVQQQVQWGRLFKDVIKIGLVLWVILNADHMLQWILQSFLQVAHDISPKADLQNIVTHPVKLWTQVYQFSMNVINPDTKSMVHQKVNLNAAIGLGILLSTLWIVLNVILQYTAFYFTGVFALLLLPFSLLKPLGQWHVTVFAQLLKAGMRVAVMLTVLAAYMVMWAKADLTSLVPPYPLNLVLAVFLSTTVLAYLMHKLPGLIANGFGQLMPSVEVTVSPEAATTNVSVNAAASAASLQSTPAAMTAATQLSAGHASATSTTVSPATQPTTGSALSREDKDLLKASQLEGHFKQALREMVGRQEG